MSIQLNPRWRAFEKGISIYRHCCSKFTKKKKKGHWYRYLSYRYRYHSVKKWQWPFGTGTALTGTGIAERVWGKLGFLTPTRPLPYKTNPSPFVLSHEQIQDHMFLPAFSPFRPGSFSVRSTDVLSTPYFFESIFLWYFIVSPWIFLGGSGW